MLGRYNAYVQDVKDSCPPERLLVFRAEDGWEPLCSFLRVPVPNIPYPRVNDAQEFSRRMEHVTTVGYTVLFFMVLSYSLQWLGAKGKRKGQSETSTTSDTNQNNPLFVF